MDNLGYLELADPKARKDCQDHPAAWAFLESEEKKEKQDLVVCLAFLDSKDVMAVLVFLACLDTKVTSEHQ